MKLFKPLNGGHRLFLDDLELLQNAYSDALKGIISSLNPTTSCILSGTSLTQSLNNYNLSSGYVAFKGEVFSVAASTFPYQPLPARVFLKITQTIMAPSPVTYKDATIKNVHFERVMTAKYYSANDGDIDGTNGIYYDEIAPGGVMQKGFVIEFHPSYAGEQNDVFDETGLGKNRMLGFAVCNGLNGTPDLRGQFTIQPSVGIGNSAALLPAVVVGTSVGDKIGNNTVSILQTNLPAYNLNVTDPGHAHPIVLTENGQGSDTGRLPVHPAISDNNNTPEATGLSAVATTGITVNTGGGNQPLNALPPAYAMIKIKRII